MRKGLAAALLIAAVGVLPSQAAGPEGCVAHNPGRSHAVPLPNQQTGMAGGTWCTYKATTPGSIVAFGNWSVKIYWDGTCGPEAPDWIRRSDNLDNNTGLFGLWEYTIPVGACTVATANTAGSWVAVGEVESSRPPLSPPSA